MRLCKNSTAKHNSTNTHTPAVELVDNMAAIHDLSEEVAQVAVGHGLAATCARAGIELIDHDVTALLKVTKGEAIKVAAVPAHVSELLTPINARMEDAESEKQGAEVFRALAAVERRLVEVGPCAEQKLSQRLGGFV